MLKTMKTILSLFIFLFLSNLNFSQSNQAICFNIQKISSPSEIYSYISEKYGDADAERIILNLRNYEKVNAVKVLCQMTYNLKIEQINAQLKLTQDLEQINFLNEKKKRFVLIYTIENQII
jgi:hypothetical protein